MYKSLKSWRVLAALVGTMAMPAGSWAASSVSVSNLQYSLVDMNTSDGVTSSIVFGTLAGQPARGQAWLLDNGPLLTSNEITATTSDLPFGTPGTLLSLPDDRGRVVVGSNSIEVSTRVNDAKLDELLDAVHATPWSYASTGTYATASNRPAELNLDTDYTFVLSPGTLLTVSGTIRLNPEDSQSIAGMASLLQTAAQQDDVKFRYSDHQEALVYLFLESGYEGLQVVDRDVRALDREITIDANGVAVNDAPGLAQEYAFTLSINNVANVSRKGRFAYDLFGSTSLSSLPLAVPEPATWASFAFGLMLMSAAVVRHSKRELS